MAYKVIPGGYGVVAIPALSNTNESGAEVNFGNTYVTKMFYNPANKKEIMNSATKLSELLGEENAGHAIYNYKRNYKYKNLPSALKIKFKDAMKTGDLSVNRAMQLQHAPMLSMVRMPNLGVDILTAIHDTSVIEQLHKIPIDVCMSEMLKVLRQLKHLNNNSYIHGDVRDTNIVINPKTGIITLIDFDTLTHKDNILKFKNMYLYSSPPELFLTQYLFNFVPLNNTQDINNELIRIYKYDRQFHERYNEYYDKHKLLNDYYLFGIKILASNIRKTIISNLEYIKGELDRYENIEHVFKEVVFPTIDGFGFGLTFLLFFKYVYKPVFNAVDDDDMTAMFELKKDLIDESGTPRYTNHQIKNIFTNMRNIITVLKHMYSFNLATRYTIQKAYDEIEKCVKNIVEAVGTAPAGGAGASAATRRRRRHRRGGARTLRHKK